MSLDVETPRASSSHLRDERESKDSYGLLEDADTLRATPRSYRYIHVWSWIGQFVLFLTSLFIALRRPAAPNCVEKLSSFSPALAAVSDDYLDIRFNSTIFGGSPYTGAPSPELDERWAELVRDGAFGISPDELLKLGGSPDSVQLPDEIGGGYMGWLEVYHQIHCLHTLWKNTWPSYYNTTEMGSQDINSTYRKHVDHCADNLRQKLMCDADVGIVTFDWLKQYKHPVPNFNTLHKCRNLDAIWDWHAEHRARRRGAELTKTPDSVVLDHLP